MNRLELTKVVEDLVSFIEAEEYKGYDPYDTLNSPIPFGVFGKWGKPIAIQLQKRNPVNIRPLIGIKKGYNPKAMGLLLHAYTMQYKRTNDSSLLQNMDYLFDWLINNYTKGYSGYCWGYNFDWASSVKLLPAYSPTIVVSGFVAKGIREYHTLTKNKKAIEVLRSIAEFVDQDLEKTKDETGLCISYSTLEADCCYNASMLGAELFAYLYAETKETRYKDLALECSRFVVARQLEDGRWNYSLNIKTGNERTQIDFHQGYVLDSLAYVMKYIPETAKDFEAAWKKGMDFYAKHQFTKNGAAIYRYPAVWPVDIHNQAQGVISFSRWSRGSIDLELSGKVAAYSVERMRSKKGYFHYKKYPWVSIKTPFMRWGQAWMFLALEERLAKMDDLNG